MAEENGKPKFLKRVVYGFASGLPAGFALYALGTVADKVASIGDLGLIGFGIGFGSALAIQIGRSIWE